MKRIATFGARTLEVYVDGILKRKPGRDTDRVFDAIGALESLGYRINCVDSQENVHRTRRTYRLCTRELNPDEIREIILEDVRRNESKEQVHADARLTDAGVSPYKIGAYLSHVSRGTYHKRKLLEKNQRLRA